MAIFDEISFAGREHELAAGDVHLTATKRNRIESILHRANDFFRRAFPRQHERVSHARHGNGRIALTAPVAGERHFHQSGIQPVLQVAFKDTLLDQHRALRRRAFVIDIEGAAARRDRPIIDHRAKLRGDPLTDAATKSRGLLAVEIAFEAMADCLVE